MKMRVKLRSGTVICISTLLATQVKPGRTATLPVISPDFSNLEACLNATIEADINQDGIIQEYEYPDFLTSLGDDINDHRNYDDLPITAKLNFMYLSCWCGKNISCCKGKEKGIIVNGAALERICAYTQMTAAYVSQGEETAMPTPLMVETTQPSFRPLKPDEFESSYSPTSFLETGTIAVVDSTATPSAAMDLSASPSASTSLHMPSFNKTGSTNMSPFGPSGSPSTIDTWDEKFSAIVPTSKGNVGHSNEQSNSLPPAAIVGVAAAVAIVIASWFAGLFASSGVDEEVDPKSEHDLELGRTDPKSTANGEVKSSSLPIDEISFDDSDRSSGWSSSAGLSSLRTATFDSLTDDGIPPISSTIENLSALSSITETATPIITPISQSETLEDSRKWNNPNKRASREDLIAAIEAGDWTLVGATAALLVSSSSGHSVASNQGTVITYGTDLSIDNSLASEFSRLVDSNDFEGVIQLTAMLDGASDSESTTVQHITSGELQDKADIQALIVDLVKEIVPDELEHLEEMLRQFENREEELVHTLRMMQERNIEQKQTQALHKQKLAKGISLVLDESDSLTESEVCKVDSSSTQESSVGKTK